MSGAEVVLPSSTRAQRRQNTSCDPCRRSKRRCFFQSPTEDDANIVCAHCRRLGHECTFHFATARLNSRPKKRQRRSQPRRDQSAYPEENDFESASIALPEISAFQDDLNDFPSWLNLDMDRHFDDNVPYVSNNLSAFASFTTSPLECMAPTELENDDGTPQNSRIMDSALPLTTGHFVGSTLRSPVYLLNSKMNSNILDDRLCRIYETIVTGSASRFLGYASNLYATGHRYQIEDSSPETPQKCSPSPRSGSFFQLQPSRTRRSSVHATMPDDSFSMTLLGCFRFLDHFGDLYGNKMSPASRRQSDSALKAALRAFSLQWLPSSGSDPENNLSGIANGQRPSSDPSLDIYTDAWFRARNRLRDANSVQSFRVVFATLIFDGIAIPAKAHNALNEPSIEHEFLDTGLQKLRDLDERVKQYCDTLGPFSQYSALLEASLSLVRWSSYIRDTGAALTGDHQCKLPELFVQSDAFPNGITIPIHLLEDLDHSIPNICRKAAAEAVCVWRKIANVKNSLHKLADGVSSLSAGTFETISSTMRAIEKFDESFRPFMAHCRDIFQDLSISSRIAFMSLAIPWDLGALVLAEIMPPFAEEINQSYDSNLIPRISASQKEAATSVSQTIDCMLTLPAEETFNLQNGLSAEVPIMAYHVTPNIMTAALEKALEYVLESQVSHSERSNDNAPDPIPDGVWERQVDCLMKGLLSLDVTVGGSQTAGVVRQSLMQRYGDVISECWSCDFST
ncbi:hypothetical protein N7474_007895 [Penicillium riverlandense]|uniref:uncharacterized protein n=1 Tax=Penicillium riverlandense TaxID=1903569 RepID=UPI0025486FBC|nr:uncharacterized protein N7474_007895 [Penicillium riverlandense]KAJ5811594.1 hypothetical protein N7474_007895 [Penicillium riverlandense]